MNLEELNIEIELWKSIFKEEVNDIFYEIAFFKIFVKFEKFMIAAFIHYATGGKSENGYIPERQLKFNSLSHLEGVFIIESKKYLIEKPESINQLSKHIFCDMDNPFEAIFNDSLFSDNIIYMRIIRNFVAHGSDESLRKYIKVICNDQNFFSPSVYLLKNRKGQRVKNYTFFVDLLKVHSELIFKYTKS